MKRLAIGVLCLGLLGLAGAPASNAAFDDPLLIFKPHYEAPAPPSPPPPPIPPPDGDFEGPCGLAVDAGGNFYVSDYYHRAIDLFSPVFDSDPKKSGAAYLTQLADTDLLQGPCAIALDGLGHLYAGNFDANVVRFTTSPFDAGTVVDSGYTTGVAVDPATNNLYVNERTRIAVYDSSGSRLGEIGNGSLTDAYGLAVSGFNGRLYVPDAAGDTVKVYEPTLGTTDPIAVIDGSGTPKGHFTSLRNSAAAVDNASGKLYVADDLQPEYSERGETVIYVFSSSGGYEGRLKYSVENGLPAGLAVDNSGTAGQGRVFVTSGSTELGSVYAYRPNAATTTAVPLPPLPPGAGVGGGSGSGAAISSPSAAQAPLGAEGSPATALDAATPAQAKSPKRKPRRAHRGHHRRQRSAKR